MNDTEKEGCRKLLSMLTYGDLSSLVDTTTKKQISVTRSSEAIKAIIEYTPSAIDLLKRKKVKRDLLFKFLAEQNVIVPVNLDKSGLIRMILKKWGTKIREDDFMDIDHDEDKQTSTQTRNQNSQDAGNQSFDSRSQSLSPGAQRVDGENQSINARNMSQLGGAQRDDTGNQHVHYNIQSVNITNIHTAASTSFQRSQGQSTILDLNNGDGTQPNDNVPDIVKSTNIDNTSSKAITTEFQTLGEKFAEWFFNNLNSHCPSMQKTPGDFGPYHFWDDAYLLLSSYTPDHNEEKFVGSGLVSQRFLAFAKEEQVLFNPNLTSEGIYVKSSQHGLVMILVCGTLHRQNECLGVFQQSFGIIKDPRFDNNWKIKMIKLDVKTSKPTAMPKLEGNLDSQIMALVPV